MKFEIKSKYSPQGDQESAIRKLVEGVKQNVKNQTLLGVTGSGKTFTMANVIEKLGVPTLVLSHNKTLAAQLYGEFKQFFPDNCVEYYVSYYDYYQPEAYLPVSNKYIAKDLAINDELEKLRLRSTAALLSGRSDVIVVSSVSCIYGITNPLEFKKSILNINTGDQISMRNLLMKFVDMLYSRNDIDFQRGTFRVKGDTVDLYLAYADFAYRIIFWGDKIEEIYSVDPKTGEILSRENHSTIFPANLFVTSKDTINLAIKDIKNDLDDRLEFYRARKLLDEAHRLEQRTNLDLEMMEELGYCAGIENYSRYLDRRLPGQRPYCLLDYFPKDYLLLVDESHVTIPQIRAMWGGDRARKLNLIDHGFRLPSAADNRPLKFEEYENLTNNVIFVSATPSEYEIEKSEGVIVEQLIRPTGLLDPEIFVRPTLNQIDNILYEIHQTIAAKNRILITTLTKRMAEELTDFLEASRIKCKYIHSEVKTIERVEILRQLRLGLIDVLVGVNLLREGLDLPEVSLVIILDADKEGFLRNVKSLIQTIGRAARNVEGRVIMYADKITDSMQQAMDETARRRKLQNEFNIKNGITPQGLGKSVEEVMKQTKVASNKYMTIYKDFEHEDIELNVAAEDSSTYLSKPRMKELIKNYKKEMKIAANEMRFMEAARLRDEIKSLEEKLSL